jgi:hypothetical protein
MNNLLVEAYADECYDRFLAKMREQSIQHFEECDYASLARQVSRCPSERHPKYRRNNLGGMCHSVVDK